MINTEAVLYLIIKLNRNYFKDHLSAKHTNGSTDLPYYKMAVSLLCFFRNVGKKRPGPKPDI